MAVRAGSAFLHQEKSRSRNIPPWPHDVHKFRLRYNKEIHVVHTFLHTLDGGCNCLHTNGGLHNYVCQSGDNGLSVTHILFDQVFRNVTVRQCLTRADGTRGRMLDAATDRGPDVGVTPAIFEIVQTEFILTIVKYADNVRPLVTTLGKPVQGRGLHVLSSCSAPLNSTYIYTFVFNVCNCCFSTLLATTPAGLTEHGRSNRYK